jgi:outer membrane lipoprotein-sorting protein
MKQLLSWLTLVMISSGSLFAQSDAQSQKILKGVSARYKSYSSLSASFTLNILDQKSQKQEKQSGSILLKGDQFRLSMNDQTIISDGKTTWTYLKESNEVQISENVTDENAITPANIFTMYEKGFKSKFNGEKSVNGKTQQIIELVPEDTKKSFFKVQLQIDKAGQYVSEAKVFDKSGNIYTYSIQKFTPNATVTNDQFTFNAATYPGVEIVDLR